MTTQEKTDVEGITGVRVMTMEEWKAEAERRFGENPMYWRFVCCNCGHVQTVSDFRELHKLGLFTGMPSVAYFSCIGRSDTRIPNMRIGTLGDTKNKAACDYTLGGIFALNTLAVKTPDGAINPVFEFAEPAAETEIAGREEEGS